jgi:hypothetical protein
MKSNGYEDFMELERYYFNRLLDIMNSIGKQAIGWEVNHQFVTSIIVKYSRKFSTMEFTGRILSCKFGRETMVVGPMKCNGQQPLVNTTLEILI